MFCKLEFVTVFLLAAILDFETSNFHCFCLLHSSGVTAKTCGKSRKCSKVSGHSGKCNSSRTVNRFWEQSPVYNINKRAQCLNEQFKELTTREDAVLEREAHLAKKEDEISSLEEQSMERLAETGILDHLLRNLFCLNVMCPDICISSSNT